MKKYFVNNYLSQSIVNSTNLKKEKQNYKIERKVV